MLPSQVKNLYDISLTLMGSYFTLSLGSFFRSTHPSHDDHGKTIGDIENRFFAFNC
jgi:hypothetical protein